MISKIIAQALFQYLSNQIQGESQTTRHFFRLDGFDEESYCYLLSLIQAQNTTLANTSVELRTTSPIASFEHYACEAGKSATWYRNNVQAGQILLLIFNQHTSDAQSLKDIYPVTESLLAEEGFNELITAAFTQYQLIQEEIDTLAEFLKRVKSRLFQPQLRDLTAFMMAIDHRLKSGQSETLALAIAQSLPQIGLFSCRDLAPLLNQSRGDKLLHTLYNAARYGSEILEERQLNDFLQKLEQAKTEDAFEDSSDYGGLSIDQKCTLLHCFLTDVIVDRKQLLQVLQIDWQEVSLVLYKKIRHTKADKLKALATEIAQALKEQQIENNELTDSAQDALEDLEKGQTPNNADLEQLIGEQQENLGKLLANKLRRLSSTKTHTDSDFIAAITNLAINLLAPYQEEINTHNFELSVAFDAKAIDTKDKVLPEAIAAFWILHGGLENLMPAITWQLDSLWALVKEQADFNTDIEVDLTEDVPKETTSKTSLPFKVTLKDQNSSLKLRANLIWLYRTDSPQAATLANLQAEANQLAVFPTIKAALPQTPPSLPIPIYNTCPPTNNIGDLNLSNPLRSLGVWYSGNSTNLRLALNDVLKHNAAPNTIKTLDEALQKLETAWGIFVHQAIANSLLTPTLTPLLEAYQALLAISLDTLQRGKEVPYASRLLTQAWVVGAKYFEEWAVLPLLHPLKLHWWHERGRYFNQIISTLLDSKQSTDIIDATRFRQDLSSMYSSANYPTILALPGRNNLPKYFLPVNEMDGYELYRRQDKASIAYGLDPDLVSEEESKQTANIAAYDLARVVEDYIETYPFVQDGLEIYLLECRNSALPGRLMERLNKIATRRGWQVRVNLFVQSSNRGASIYHHLAAWLREHEEFISRPIEGYFPPVTLKVIETDLNDDFFNRLEDTDLVILPDVLAEKGQTVIATTNTNVEDIPLMGYIAKDHGQQAPFEEFELSRDILLTPNKQPALVRYFYNLQYIAKNKRSIPTTQAVNFKLQVSLEEWEQELANLHKHFNWVICYDTTIDRFLLEASFVDVVQVIRYSLGLGTKKRHNLTVSSSYRAQDIVIKRLTQRLDELLPHTPLDYRTQVANELVNEAKSISGDIVLRAAGPGMFVNELIGLIMAKRLTEERYLRDNPDALITWIYLDDFSHWFNKKFPDLLFIAVPAKANGSLPLHIEIIEAKCVGESNFPVEATDAQKQVSAGVNRLAAAWSSGGHHLDADYWYDQLYRAIVGNLSIDHAQRRLWEVIRHRLPNGDFTAHISGHAWAFCYDGSAGISNYLDEGEAKITAKDYAHIPHRYYHYNRTGLRKLLRALVEDTWQIPSPPNIWDSKNDEPTKDLYDPEKEVDTLPVTVAPIDDPALTTTTKTDDPTVEPINPISPPSTPTLDYTWLEQIGQDLKRVLRDYGLKAHPVKVDDADIGPSIVRFKVRLKPGEQLSRLQRIADDLARELRLSSVPLIDNILGTRFVGIDVPRPQTDIVPLLPLLQNLPPSAPAELPIVLGRTPDGQTIIEDLAEFPHLLVAGATNSGKSVFLRSLLLGLMQQYPPYKIHFLIVDPKRTDFTFFNGLPYLLGDDVITDNNVARDALMSLVLGEMPKRQEIMAGRSMKIKEFNQRYPDEALPPIVAVIDEYAQLLSIMSKKERNEFERDLMSLAAVARATGIHLILATQRPSADVVTGTLKANLPASIAFKVASATNSRIIIDQNGAENLLGRGDLLFRKPSGEIIRLQAPFIDEVALIKMLEKLKTTDNG